MQKLSLVPGLKEAGSPGRGWGMANGEHQIHVSWQK